MIASPRIAPPGSCAPCPICRGASQRLFQKHQYWIRGCRVCQHRFTEFNPADDHVNHIYADAYFQGGAAGYVDYLDEARLLRAHGQWYGRLLRRYMEPGAVLDVGAAAGFILQGFLDTGWQGRGVEPNANMANYARTQLGICVDTGSLEQFCGREQYRLVSMIQVVAHFMDVSKAFQVAAQVTQPQGFWLIETWNRDSWTAWLFGQQWHEYSPPSVLHWFAPDGLQRLASQFGFAEVARGRPAKWLNGAHAKSLLQYKLAEAPCGRLASKVVQMIPACLSIPYPAEDLFWMLLQKT